VQSSSRSSPGASLTAQAYLSIVAHGRIVPVATVVVSMEVQCFGSKGVSSAGHEFCPRAGGGTGVRADKRTTGTPGDALESGIAAFFVANANGAHYVVNKDLAVTNAPGTRRRDQCANDVIGTV
jgi:hypothetical protein